MYPWMRSLQLWALIFYSSSHIPRSLQKDLELKAQLLRSEYRSPLCSKKLINIFYLSVWAHFTVRTQVLKSQKSPRRFQANRQSRSGFGIYKGIHPREFCKIWIYGVSSSGDSKKAKGNKWGFIWGYIKSGHVRNINHWGKHFKSKVNHS